MEVADKMLLKALLNTSSYKLISNAPCDYIRNKIIVEQLRQKDTSCLFMFLYILQEIGNYGVIHDKLISGKDYICIIIIIQYGSYCVLGIMEVCCF